MDPTCVEWGLSIYQVTAMPPTKVTLSLHPQGCPSPFSMLPLLTPSQLQPLLPPCSLLQHSRLVSPQGLWLLLPAKKVSLSNCKFQMQVLIDIPNCVESGLG